MLTLQDLLNAFAEGGAAAVQARLAEAPELTPADLRAEAADAFQALYASEGRTADDVAQMGVLADVIDVLRAEETARTEASAAAQAEADALAARALGAQTASDEGGEQEQPAEDNAQPEGDDDEGAEQPPAAGQDASVVVQASGNVPAQRRRRVDLASIRSRAPQAQPPATPAQVESQASLVAAADVPGFSTGMTLDFDSAAQALLARSTAMPTDYVPGKHIRHQFAMVRKPDSPFRADGRDDQAVIDAAAEEGRLEGGSLLAAGGWCAPSETWYDLCPGLESRAGLIDLPSVRAMRGGVRWTKGPQFCDFYSGEGFFSMTEAQDIAGFTKPCFEIPCPEFDECRLEAHGLCLTAGILQNRGYPEYVRRFIEGSLVAHAHRLNALKIAAMVAQATQHAATVDTAAVGATAGLFSALELLVENYRYKFRMDPSRTLEVVAPIWLRGVIRSDLSKRSGVPIESVTDADINRMFAEHGARVQWVYDWQDALCGTQNAGGGTMGSDLPPATWPDEVQLLIYPAGTYVLLEQDVITLESVYDSTLFRQNRYTALFTEEAFCVINRCYEAVNLTVPICASGITSGTAIPACPTV